MLAAPAAGSGGGGREGCEDCKGSNQRSVVRSLPLLVWPLPLRSPSHISALMRAHTHSHTHNCSAKIAALAKDHERIAKEYKAKAAEVRKVKHSAAAKERKVRP